MNDIKKQALEISREFPFSPYELKAEAENGHDGSAETFASCENHLDLEFMKLLEQGEHLDPDRMPM